MDTTMIPFVDVSMVQRPEASVVFFFSIFEPVFS